MLHYYTNLIQKTMALAVVLFIGFTSNAQVTLNAWDSNGLSGTTADGWQANTVEANMTTGEVSRGPGINAASLTNAFSSNGWNVASLDPDRYFEFFVEPQAGFEQSLNEVGVALRRSSTGPNSFQLAYRVGPTGAFTNIGTGFTYTGTATNGALQGPFDLSGISALQGVTERVTFRLYGWGSTSSGGTLAIGRISGDDLYITGATAPSGAAVDPEPTNHASALACAAGGQAFSSLDLSWTDATGGQAPAGYLLRWSTTGFGDITDPVDGDAVAGSNDLFIDQGVQTASLTGLDAGTTYFFKLFPYSNAGANIDYKTDGSVPETNCTTAAAPCFSETFSNITPSTPTAAGTYGLKQWTGDSGVAFEATDALANQTINGSAILIRNGALTAAAIPGGASSLTLTTQREFGGGSGNLTVSINGDVVDLIPYGTDVQTTTISGFEIAGTFSLSISSSNADRIKLDDLFIECFNPDFHPLASEDYLFDAWDASSLSGTYPTNMEFSWSNDPTGSGFNRLEDGTNLYDCGYDLTSRSRINGQGINGFSFISTGSPQRNDCISGDADNDRYVGSAALKLNTEGVTYARVEWIARTILRNERNMAIGLQYRVGSTGNYTDFGASTVYLADGTNDDAFAAFSFELPAVVLNESEVYLRWVYYQDNDENSGQRAEIGIDDILVTTEEVSALVPNELHNLSSADYAMNEWASTEAGGTYPANMIFLFNNDPGSGSFDLTDDGTRPYDCGYDLGSRPRFNGLGADGFSVITTGDPQRNDCISGTADSDRFTGSAVLGLNTIGVEYARVEWTVGVIVRNARDFGIQLQYRLGTEGSYTNFDATTLFSAVGTTTGDTARFEFTLPSEVLNEPAVYLRWAYYQLPSSPGGARPELRIDDILVTTEEPVVPASLHVLSADDYELNAWAASESAGTFPSSMLFTHSIDPGAFEYDRLADGTAPYKCAYNQPSRPRINGLGDDGFSFITTGSPQYDNCSNGTAEENRYIGGAVLGLNTTGVTYARAEWTATTIARNERDFAVRLQYRIGAEGDYIDFGDETEYAVNTIAPASPDTESFFFDLPVGLLDQEEVYLRWVYYQMASSGGGARPEIAIDNILVTTNNDVFGCTDGTACNFNNLATVDDGSCVLPGDACDDGNPFTYGDTITAGCGCEGTPYSIVTQWNFNDVEGNGTDEASIGEGSIAVIGGASNSGFNSGGGSSDTVQPGLGYQVVDFPAQSTNSGQAGIEVAVNTTAYQDISFIFDLRTSNTASRWFQVQYSLNGTDFIDFGTPVRLGGDADVSVGDSWSNQLAADFTGISGVNDNENFKVRVLSVFSPVSFTEFNSGTAFGANAAYESARNRSFSSQSNYGGGTWRFDMVTVAGVGFGCTAPTACNYNANATLDDGTCFFVCNNTPETALNVTLTNLNAACSAITLDLEGATSSGQGTVSASNDAWFEFTAVTAGVRIEAATTEFDAVVELLDASLNTVAIEDEVFGNGSEFLNIGNLTPGDQYLVRIATINAPAGAAPVEVCLKFLPATQCNYGPGPYSLCQQFQASWAGPRVNQGGFVAAYQFTFVNTADPLNEVVWTTTGSTNVQLQQPTGLLWGAEYEVTTNVMLQLEDGNGVPSMVLVENNNNCPISITNAPQSQLEGQFDGGTFAPSALIRADWVCPANDWTWEFNTAGLLEPIIYERGAPGRGLFLNFVPGLQPGTTYDVRVKPEFANGVDVGFPAVPRQITIVGFAGMATEVESPVVMMDNDKVIVDDVFAAGIAIYPNPNRGDNFNLNISGIEAGTDRVMLDIYDLYGKLVKSEQLAVGGENLNAIVSLDGIADGMYLVNVIMDGKVYTERMIVQK